MTLLASLLALFSCKRATEERKATEAFAIKSLLTYEYCGEKDGFQYFLLGNQWERKVFKIKAQKYTLILNMLFTLIPLLSLKYLLPPLNKKESLPKSL